MTKQVKKLRESMDYVDNHKPGRDATKTRKVARETIRSSFNGKVFGDLTGDDKDDLLKAVAISIGILEE